MVATSRISLARMTTSQARSALAVCCARDEEDAKGESNSSRRLGIGKKSVKVKP